MATDLDQLQFKSNQNAIVSSIISHRGDGWMFRLRIDIANCYFRVSNQVSGNTN